jgi:hypothetical protein
VVKACRRAEARFSLVLTRNRAVQAAIEAIAEDAWIAVRYPGAVQDLDTGAWISDAEVAVISYPWELAWLALWRNTIGHPPTT